MPSWLLSRNALVARHLVTERLAPLAGHRYHFSTLTALAELGALSQADLGRRCGLDRSDVAAAVADLEARGYLERRPDPQDRRRNTVEITPAGRQHLAELDQVVDRAQEDLLAPLSAEERSQLVRLLNRLSDHHTDVS